MNTVLYGLYRPEDGGEVLVLIVCLRLLLLTEELVLSLEEGQLLSQLTVCGDVTFTDCRHPPHGLEDLFDNVVLGSERKLLADSCENVVSKKKQILT